ncbi:hypothetical protein P152DRAFT_461649 [Eremomyces bilateralis CBS 781.70]|uniref:Zn(2)-C6 fungal-type domain-containing protein n=1 Tax=Eremomyces bilateralis CBS 781.70 TaxID=1392243 RepID=A0A6G1FTX8_9PEZI|nr:uncharacterized protein P152DRAFT_461649 [Eremomyces bilateralis CBS 781.70]KAF1809224.1 hypothetical protein P152DRAFT_461649 [Eremomyces bilateralis CBS 781.70]
MSGKGDTASHQSTTRSCEYCRTRKVRCDTQRPSCGSCFRQNRKCVYVFQPRKARPTLAMLEELRTENARLCAMIQRMGGMRSPDAGSNVADALQADDSQSLIQQQQRQQQVSHPASGELEVASSVIGEVQPSASQNQADSGGISHELFDSTDRSNDASMPGEARTNEGGPATVESTPDVSPYLWTDEKGKVNAFGPSSALQSRPNTARQEDRVVSVHMQNALLANAVISRQNEHKLRELVSLDGVPIDLAIHLLDLHWNRQHHTFLLTYRPAIMRDILRGGRFASKLLINAIFACASKFSQRAAVMDDPQNPSTAGGRFFRRCDELMEEKQLLLTPSIPTIAGLLLLGSSYIAKGSTSKGWMLTGSALRMIFDLGLHLDHKITDENAEEVEMYRRVFWGAFICDKLQSLYLGRPVGIRLRDAYVSHELNDHLEENELWAPYIDPSIPEDRLRLGSAPQGLIYSVSYFQQICLLFKIVDRIIDIFYVVGATPAEAQASLKGIDNALEKWEADLPGFIRLDPISATLEGGRIPAPNMLALHILYHAVIILLHRPLVAEGHLNWATTVPATSWKRCSVAARNITSLAIAYQSRYTLRAAPYLIAYGLYVASTIHVRNTAAAPNPTGDHSVLLAWSLRCLRDLSVPNPGVSHLTSIIEKLMVTKGVEIAADPTSGPEAAPNAASEHIAGLHCEYASAVRFDSGVQSTSLSIGEAEFDWSNWHESFEDDVLFGFMGWQSYQLGDSAPQPMGGTTSCLDPFESPVMQ